jgi:hypothetical protein
MTRRIARTSAPSSRASGIAELAIVKIEPKRIVTAAPVVL